MWSHDSTELFFMAGDAMMSSTITAGSTFGWERPVALFDGAYLLAGEGFAALFDVSPDGRFLMLKRAGAASDEDVGKPELIAVFNWFEELKARVTVP